MKKNLTFVLLLASVTSLSAQNTFPSTGNVGIGTTSPGYKLTILTANSLGFGISGNDNRFVDPDISVSRTNTAFGVGRGACIQLVDNSTNYSAMLQSSAGNFQIFNYAGSNGWSESMRVAGNGYVGIGSTNPGSLLSLGSSTQHNKLSLFESGNYRWGFGITSQQFEQYMANDNATNHISWGSMSTDGNQTFTELMRLRLNGQVIIGATNFATSATYQSGVNMLSVGGGIESDAITVKTQGTWPDYVFKPKYILQPLSEVKTYIKENHRLPGMPSEDDIAKNGQNLGEINKLLVKKVEELTLYALDQNKQLTAEKKKNIEQETRLKKLEEDVQLLLNKISK